MRILMLNYEFPPIGGGAGEISRHIAEGLASRGHYVHVLTAGLKDAPDSVVENDVQVTRLKSKRKYQYQSNPREMVSWMRMAKKFLRTHLKLNEYNICFAHFALPGGEVAYSMKNAFGLPYVVMSHGHDIPWFFPKQMFVYHALTYQWIRKIVINSQKLFVQSDAMETNARSFLGKKHYGLVCQIPNGWDAGFFYPAKQRSDGAFQLVFPGRLVKQKDPFTLLKAVRLVRKDIPDMQVQILGDGPLRKSMQAYVRKYNLAETVRFEGWVDKKRMRQAYQQADVVVLPSLNEGMSMATLEAMACGAYLLVTDVSRNADLIETGVNGDIIPPSDFNHLAEAIVDYYKTKYPEYRVPVSVFEKLNAYYAWEQVVNKYDNVLKEISRVR
ncbi:MAG TPA: glycosyltransferase family 4 protein [Bacteroidales bacterium]|nr:glycosyltransferase family 4 protein [Bacteroidales bacterium]